MTKFYYAYCNNDECIFATTAYKKRNTANWYRYKHKKLFGHDVQVITYDL